jgi:hypothetical protein
MNTQTLGKNRINTLLVLFVLINIIGDIGNVAFWHANPSSQGSIVPGTMGGTATNGGYLYGLTKDAGMTLAIGSTILTIIAVVYAVALFGLLRKQKWGALVVIGISIVNRVFAVFLYEVSVAFAFWGVWTVILVVVAYLDWRKLPANKSPPAKEFTVTPEAPVAPAAQA